MQEFDIQPDESFSDWKIRKNAEKGLKGLGQSN